MTEQVAFERISPVVPVWTSTLPWIATGALASTCSRPPATSDMASSGAALCRSISLNGMNTSRGEPLLRFPSTFLTPMPCTEWAAAGVGGRLGDPVDTAYGLREFRYVDPDGTLVRVGSPFNSSTG